MFAQNAPPESFFVISAVFHCLGPAFAVLLFARVDVLGVAWLRSANEVVSVALVVAGVAVHRDRPDDPAGLFAEGTR